MRTACGSKTCPKLLVNQSSLRSSCRCLFFLFAFEKSVSVCVCSEQLPFFGQSIVSWVLLFCRCVFCCLRFKGHRQERVGVEADDHAAREQLREPREPQRVR